MEPTGVECPNAQRRKRFWYTYYLLQKYLHESGKNSVTFTVHDLTNHYSLSPENARALGSALSRGTPNYHRETDLPPIRWHMVRKDEKTNRIVYFLEYAPIGRPKP